MIIIRYLIQEVLKSQITILFILLLIFFSQKLVRILSESIEGEIPTNLVLSILGLEIPEIAQLILPLSLFLGLLITFGRLYATNEITVMHACGLGKIILIKAAIILAIFTSILTSIIVIWIEPWSSRYQKNMLAEAKTSLGVALLTQGQFQKISDGNAVLFIESVEKNHFYNIFFARLPLKDNDYPSIIVADSGQITQNADGFQVITLKKGTRFERIEALSNFRIDNFYNYQAIIDHQSITVDPYNADKMNMYMLFNFDTNQSKAEVHWRVTLIFIVFIMALMAIPLSLVKPRRGRILSIIPAMLLYLSFLLIQASIKSNAEKGKIDPIFWTWIVNGTYLFLAITLNFLDSISVHHMKIYLLKLIHKGKF